MKHLFLILGIIIAGSLVGQGYQYQCNINEAAVSGFHSVPLNPEVLEKLNSDFSDIRLVDKKGVEQPYFIRKESFEVRKRVFKEYKLIDKVNWKNGATVLFIENTDTSMINNLHLQIKNFDVRKRLELAGSDNYEQWYAIKENYVFYNANGLNTTSEIKGLFFPYCNYRYYRIIIYDWYSMPINVLKVGYYDTYHEKALFNKIADCKMQRTDSSELKQTIIKLKFNGNPYFDKLVVKAKKPEHFFRRAQFALKKKDYKGRWYFEPITYFQLNSNAEMTYFTSAFDYQECYLIIDNDDNPPLEDITIEAYQLKHELVGYFEKNEPYKLIFGSDSTVAKPVYDIVHYKSKIEKDIPVLISGSTQVYNEPKLESVKAKDRSIIWIAVVLIASLLGFISYSMINEMDKKQQI